MNNPTKEKPSRFKKVILDISPPPTVNDDEWDTSVTMSFNQLYDICMNTKWNDFEGREEEDYMSDNLEYRKSFCDYFNKLFGSKNKQSDE